MKAFTPRLLALALASSVAARKITVKNDCPFTVWPALFTDPSTGHPIPNAPTGWEAPSGSSKTITVPENWESGRIWPRTGCDFKKNVPGPQQCATGGCNGGLQCDKKTGTGVPPVTLAEWTLGNQDSYDVSMVDGTNIPVRLEAKNCPLADCPKNLNNGCPAKLQKKDQKGKVVGCLSSCAANLDGHPEDSANCCSGSHDKPETCPPSGVQYLDHFKKGCPNAYAYAYDDKTALKSCTRKSDYTLTFCPGKKSVVEDILNSQLPLMDAEW